MKLKKYLAFSMTLAVLSSPVFAQMNEEDDIIIPQDEEQECDESKMDCTEGTVKEANRSIYPWKPFDTKEIDARVARLTENTNYIRNVFEMEAKELNVKRTANQPWGGSYWFQNQGLIANPYQKKDYTTFLFTGIKLLSWRANINMWENRQEDVLPQIPYMSEKQLSELAPSEKYEVLIGDTTHDLTRRQWAHVEKWGLEKKWGYLTSIDLPDGYEISKANHYMALWEGICHGWALASGMAPRPEKTVEVTLPNGKTLPFYPNDIKALVSLMFANSEIQGQVMFEGNRCNRKSPDRDKHGRYIDTKLDRDDTELLPRCADVHPAIFHMAAVNILGVEGRSFVLDHIATATIANQPVSGYELVYFNPRTGKEGTAMSSAISREEYGKKDKYAENRHPSATQIIGVKFKLSYINWEFPRKKLFNSPADDKVSDQTFFYDLELDDNGNIVGGQWRVGYKIGDGLFGTGKTKQPDFFWVAPRQWQKFFPRTKLENDWHVMSGQPAPQSVRDAAMASHGYTLEESSAFIKDMKCPAIPTAGGPSIKVNCSFRYPKPQPLIEVVMQLLEESSK